ncbi:hypothetical protein Tco_0074016 [Tanacetum coccineum]
MEHTFEQPSSAQQPPTPRQEATTSQLMARIDDLEKQLKETKQTFGKAILTLVERVKSLEVALKRKTKRIKSVDKGKRYKKGRIQKNFAGSWIITGIDPVTTDSIRSRLAEAIRLRCFRKDLWIKRRIGQQVHLDSTSYLKGWLTKKNNRGTKEKEGSREVCWKDHTVRRLAKKDGKFGKIKEESHFARKELEKKRNKPKDSNTAPENNIIKLSNNKGHEVDSIEEFEFLRSESKF